MHVFLGEATVSEWIWVRSYRIKSSPLQTLVQYGQTRFVGVIQSVFGGFLSVVQLLFFFPNLVLLIQCKASP